jgi:hypothetical protein
MKPASDDGDEPAAALSQCWWIGVFDPGFP